jgi:aldose 1-epimerase
MNLDAAGRRSLPSRAMTRDRSPAARHASALLELVCPDHAHQKADREDHHAARVAHGLGGLPIHGLLAAADGWRVDTHEAAGDGGALVASFDFGRHGRLVTAFPFPHRVVFEASLLGSTLTVSASVHASRETPVPISFGYHPYLRLPGVDRADWEVTVPVCEGMKLDRRMLPTGEREAVQVESGPLGSRTFDDEYVAPAEATPFVLAGGGRRVELSIGRGYRFAQVYAPADDDVIAFEPMTAPTNALVSGGGDLPLIASGDHYEATFSITLADEDQPSTGR